MTEPATIEPTPVKIVTEIPAVFADGVISQVYGVGISKFFLGRIDPDPHAQKAGTNVPVVQVIMPAEGFAEMVAFFEFRLGLMVEAGHVSASFVEEAKNKWRKK